MFSSFFSNCGITSTPPPISVALKISCLEPHTNLSRIHPIENATYELITASYSWALPASVWAWGERVYVPPWIYRAPRRHPVQNTLVPHVLQCRGTATSPAPSCVPRVDPLHARTRASHAGGDAPWLREAHPGDEGYPPCRRLVECNEMNCRSAACLHSSHPDLNCLMAFHRKTDSVLW